MELNVLDRVKSSTLAVKKKKKKCKITEVRRIFITICVLISVCGPKRSLSLTFMVPKSDYFILESKTYKH